LAYTIVLEFAVNEQPHAIQGRDCIVDVGEVPDELPVLTGQVPLELLDWVVDSKVQKLIGNPERGGERMLDVF